MKILFCFSLQLAVRVLRAKVYSGYFPSEILSYFGIILSRKYRKKEKEQRTFHIHQFTEINQQT